MWVIVRTEPGPFGIYAINGKQSKIRFRYRPTKSKMSITFHETIKQTKKKEQHQQQQQANYFRKFIFDFILKHLHL